jgi:DNA-3-methyladenine glycosylase
MILSRNFYEGDDILAISKSLLGKKLCTNIEGDFTSGIIVEAEAYKAPEDKASHAYGNKITPRTKTMFSGPGTGYVYIIYGMYHLFNVISGPVGTAHCILIRAIEPLDGIDIMQRRRGMPKLQKSLTNGPGKFSIAMGIHKNFDGTDLTHKSDIWIEEAWPEVDESEIIVGPRVGMSTAEECSNWPFRFRIRNNKWTSKPDKVWYDL